MFEQLMRRLEILEKRAKAGSLQEEVLQQLMPEIQNRFKQCVQEAVDTFYGAYDRKYYNPTESLKNIGEIILKGKGQFSILYSSDALAGHHQSAEIIFNNVFKYGFHGGSQGKGHPGVLWRTPYGIYSRWGRPAPQSESPFNLIENSFDAIWKTEFEERGLELLKQKIREEL